MTRLSLAFAVIALVVTQTASAAIPFYWWTNAKANRMVVWNNPQWVGPAGDETTILKAVCKGAPPSRKTARGVPLFHIFRCVVAYRDDTEGVVQTGRRLHICSSKRLRDHILFYGLGVPGCP